MEGLLTELLHLLAPELDVSMLDLLESVDLVAATPLARILFLFGLPAVGLAAPARDTPSELQVPSPLHHE